VARQPGLAGGGTLAGGVVPVIRVLAIAVLAAIGLAACDRGAAGASAGAQPAPASPAAALPVTRGDPVEGRRIAHRVGCTGCHGEDGAGKTLWEQPGAFKVRSANLTEKRALYDDPGLHGLLAQGRTHDGHKPFGMPVFMLQRLSQDERGDVIAWMRSLPAVANPGLESTWMSAEVRAQVEAGTFPVDDFLPDAGVRAPAERPTERLALGEYLAMTSCTECHGRDLRGWAPDDPAPSLVVAKAYTPATFERLMREGLTASGRPSKTGSMTSVARQRFAGMTDEEISALKAWLDARAP
jgi:mono/diheme cytochrome c family protein